MTTVQFSIKIHQLRERTEITCTIWKMGISTTFESKPLRSRTIRELMLKYKIFFSSSIRYHGSSSSIKCHVYHHVGGRRYTPVVCNESREPHTSHYTSRPVTIKTTNKLLKPATMQSTGRIFFKSCYDIKVKKLGYI